MRSDKFFFQTVNVFYLYFSYNKGARKIDRERDRRRKPKKGVSSIKKAKKQKIRYKD